MPAHFIIVFVAKILDPDDNVKYYGSTYSIMSIELNRER